MITYVIFYKETKESEWKTFRILMSHADTLDHRKRSGWYRSKMRPITPPLELSK